MNNFKDAYFDEYTGERLPDALVRDAMVKELTYFGDVVWEIAAAEEVKKDTGAVVVGGRGVRCNKCDTTNAETRARFVATEVNHEHDMAFYAATHPLEAKRLIFSKFAHCFHDDPDVQLSFMDVTKAYFNAAPKRRIYVRAPPELGLPKGSFGLLKRCCYGTRDAGQLWESCYSDVLCALGFQRGVSCPTAFYHPKRKIHIVVHGDDFTAMGKSADLSWYEKAVN